jgi:nicotinate-nucleotide pyrophosphorylase (carboxylating)
MWSARTYQLIELACEEDLGAGDITSDLLPGGRDEVNARVVPRQPGIICGLDLAPAVCAAFAQRLGQSLEFSTANAHDGDAVGPGSCVATLRGPQAAVLTVERTLLNFLSRMSGVATLTRQFVDAAHAANPTVQILDTRKTMPGWRELDKYAVRVGGGLNHRAGLYDAVLIKDNHLAGVPVGQWPQRLTELLRRVVGRPRFVQVEVDHLAQLAEVCKVAGVDMALLDNFSYADLRAAVAERDARGLRGKLLLEASGGVTLETVAEIAATGVDRISVGALTHSAVGLDIGLDV